MFEQLFNLIAPHLCLGCHSEGAILCSACATTVLSMPVRCFRCKARSGVRRICVSCRPLTPLYAVQIVTPYKIHARSLVRRLKYERASAAAAIISQLMAERVDLNLGDSPVVVTCAPTATGRVRERGYDQSVRIARSFAKDTALPYRSLLLRVGQTRQVGASKEDRHKQICDAFVARHPHAIKGRHIILIDDVITTGATLEAAARVLKHAGASKITAVVFAAA